MVLVLGLGVVGKAVINYFKGLGPSICFYDDKIFKYEDVPYFDCENDQIWDQINLVVASPGFALKHNIIQEAIRRRIKVTNDIAIFLSHSVNGKVIGVTGTNGKSTLCAMLHHVLGEQSVIGGNFGVSPLDFLLDSANGSSANCNERKSTKYYILELSSYQLELMDIQDIQNLYIGVITNIFEHHIARHGSFEDYVSAKCKILRAQNPLLGYCELFKTWNVSKVEGIPKDLPNSWIFDKEEYQYCWGMIELILDRLGLSKEEARVKAANYEPLHFRQEVIVRDPIVIINDSKATNATAANQALRNMQDAVVWIAGGIGTSKWDKFESEKVKKAYIYGESVHELEKLFNQCGFEEGVNYEVCKTLEVAVQKALNFSKINALPLLFSPGYASFDQFKNFEERGVVFNEYVKKYL